MSAYPSTLPIPLSSFGASFQTGVTRTKFASGRHTVVGTSGKVLFDVDFTFTFSPEERDEFVAWWNTTLKYGQEPFDLTMDTGAGDLVHTVQAVGTYREVVNVDSSTIVLGAKILNRPTNLTDEWAETYNTLPAQWPSEWLPGPDAGFYSQPAQMFESTSGVSTSRAFLAPRGDNVKLSFVLSKEQLNYFLKWFEYCVLFGRKPFVADFPVIGQRLFSFADEPTLRLSGMFYTLTLPVRACYFNGKYSVMTGWGVNWGESWGGEA